MEDTVLAILYYLAQVGWTTFRQLFILVGPGLILALGMYVISDVIRTRTTLLLGFKVAIWLTAVGTVLHELGHAIFAVLFGHKLTDVVLFRPDYARGELGHVGHMYDATNLYQVIGNFFIGIGPILLGAAVIVLSSALLVGESVFTPLHAVPVNATTFASFDLVLGWLEAVWAGALDVFGLLFAAPNLIRWQLYFFLYLVFAVGSQVKLSPSDLQGAWKGFAVVITLLLGFNLLTLWAGDYATGAILALSGLYSFFHGYMVFALILNAAIAVVLLVLAGVASAVARRW